jgi:S1-C subfamily serine protease
MRPAAVALLLLGVVAGCGGDHRAQTAPPRVVAVAVDGPGLVDERATAVAAGDDRVVTVAHVLEHGGAVRVAGHPAKVVRVDRRADLAVLHVPGLGGGPLPAFGSAAEGRVRVLRDGRVRALAPSAVRRVTAALRTPAGTVERPALELTAAAAVRPGDSGAPVTDATGRLLGIVFARGSAGAGWAVDASAVRALLR